MIFYLIGVDYKTAPIDVREGLYRAHNKINECLNAGNFKDVAILYTCNRTELYGVAGDLLEAESSIKLFRSRFNEFSSHGYIILDQKNVFRHLLRLAIGLESQIKGEPQISQQLYAWHLQVSFFEPLFGLVHKALSSASDIRVKSGLNQAENNIANLVFKDLVRRIKNHKSLEVAIVGTGKIAELFAKSKYPRFYLYFSAHKNYSRAQELASESNGKPLMLKDLPEALLRVDALISATSSPHFLFDEGYFRKILLRRNKPLYLYDLAIPRDIKPDVSNLKGIILENLDTLTCVFNEYNESLRANLFLAEDMIEEIMKEYEEIFHEDYFKDRDTAEPVGFKTG